METPSAARDREQPTPAAPWQLWLEAVILTLLVPFCGRWVDPHDPFFLSTAFPWSAVAPMLVGLRHGAIPGVASAALLVTTIGVAWRQEWIPLRDFPAQFALAVMVLGLLAGEFSDLWSRRNRRLAALVDYHRHRLEEFTRTYQVLKASHDMLQQNVAADAQSLRDALLTVRRHLEETRRADEAFGGAAESILNLFAEFGQIQVATLFATTEDGALAPGQPARLGDGPAVDPRDPMIAMALEAKKIVSVGAEFRGSEAATGLLAVVPLCDVNDRVWGVIAVQEMLFTAFQSDTLRLLAVLGGHLGDLLAFRSDRPTREQFAREVKRAISDARRHAVTSSLVRITARDDARASALFDKLVANRRGLDRAIVVENGLSRSLFLLLPLTDAVGLERYKERLHGLVQAHFGASASDAGVDIEAGVLAAESSSDELVAPLAPSLAA